jgi:acyl carrier protein
MNTQLLQLISEATGVPISEIHPEADLTTDLCLDSLSIMELILNIEEAFGIPIPDDDIDSLVTVQNLDNYIQTKMGVKQ